MKKTLYILTGRSCSGKTTLVNNALKFFGDLHECVSFTTRKKREGEIEGKDYHFISMKEFTELASNQTLVENIVYDGNNYGLAESSFSLTLDNIVIVEPSGLAILMESLNNTYDIVVIKVDELDEIISQRFINRGDKPEDANRRMINDKKIFKDIQYNHLINSEFVNLQSIILNDRLDSVSNTILKEYGYNFNQWRQNEKL